MAVLLRQATPLQLAPGGGLSERREGAGQWASVTRLFLRHAATNKTRSGDDRTSPCESLRPVTGEGRRGRDLNTRCVPFSS